MPEIKITALTDFSAYHKAMLELVARGVKAQEALQRQIDNIIKKGLLSQISETQKSEQTKTAIIKKELDERTKAELNASRKIAENHKFMSAEWRRTSWGAVRGAGRMAYRGASAISGAVGFGYGLGGVAQTGISNADDLMQAQRKLIGVQGNVAQSRQSIGAISGMAGGLGNIQTQAQLTEIMARLQAAIGEIEPAKLISLTKYTAALQTLLAERIDPESLAASVARMRNVFRESDSVITGVLYNVDRAASMAEEELGPAIARLAPLFKMTGGSAKEFGVLLAAGTRIQRGTEWVTGMRTVVTQFIRAATRENKRAEWLQQAEKQGLIDKDQAAEINAVSVTSPEMAEQTRIMRALNIRSMKDWEAEANKVGGTMELLVKIYKQFGESAFTSAIRGFNAVTPVVKELNDASSESAKEFQRLKEIIYGNIDVIRTVNQVLPEQSFQWLVLKNKMNDVSLQIGQVLVKELIAAEKPIVALAGAVAALIKGAGGAAQALGAGSREIGNVIFGVGEEEAAAKHKERGGKEILDKVKWTVPILTPFNIYTAVKDAIRDSRKESNINIKVEEGRANRVRNQAITTADL